MNKIETLTKTIKGLAKSRGAKGITIAQFIEKLVELSNGSYTKGYLIMASPHKMNKVGNTLFGRVHKLSGWGFDTNGDYTRKVNLQREREGSEANFEALPTWAEPVNKIVYRHVKEHNKLYMNVFPVSNMGFFVQYYVDGRPATESEMVIIDQFTPDRSTSSRQGTEKKIEIRRPSINNVFVVSLAGKRHFIEDNFIQLKDELAA